MSPTDQYTAKLKTIELLECIPPRIFTSCAFIMDTTLRTAWFLAAIAVIVISEVAFFFFHGIYVVNQQSSHVSKATKTLQKFFFYNLCAQTSIPMVFLCVPLVSVVWLTNTRSSMRGLFILQPEKYQI
ncbi:unnamed protein product [Caenorhabditis auriculariae]|uniref:Uncharacterized protein n=1 Tax=Caenorhabditis auriculariae TaxID=2777116 RepID=A0A8S1H227_9PELO|nr:unnamed protein product [Caenorhabditis auriculariae]